MPQKLRVFISSTMEDLANEREAVVERLKTFNMEPVNAEGLLPTGGTSWNVIEDEIKSSHIFVLILGGSYGWIPQTGYGAGLNKSVTHLEADLAKSAGLPILPFFKMLKYSTSARTDDEQRRDEFRKEIGDWTAGHFRAEFRLASDLAKKVCDALLEVFFDSFLKTRVREFAARSGVRPLESAALPKLGFSSVLSQFSQGRGVLFAGAGMSIAAGYPNAALLSEYLSRQLNLQVTGEQILSRHRFADIAALANATMGRERFISSIVTFLDTPQPVDPTQAHMKAVRFFKIIITTNYDELFERACRRQDLRFAVRTSSDESAETATDVTIYKLDGTIGLPQTLILTDKDTTKVSHNRSFWKRVHEALASKPLAVVGHSLRDTTSRSLVEGRNLDMPGVYVGPTLDPVDEITLKRFHLIGIKAEAEQFMSALSSEA